MPRDVARSRALLFADRTVVLSKKSEARFLDAGVDASRLVRIGPAIEPLAPTSEDERARARASFGIPEGTVSVVFPGDLEFGGGAALVVEAFATLGRDDAFLVVACRDKTEAAKEARRALAERASALGIAPRVLFLGETPRIHALLDAADVVALPSGDLFAKMDHPLVLLEAMSLEKPVVVAVGSAAEELAESGGAAAVEPRVDALAAELSRLLDDAGERRRRGRLARAYVVERCDRREMARAYEALYDGLVG
jgi:phosphatidylinositol alpha-1,6-mannosyltransferase